MRDIYVLKFGADVTGMAAAGFVVAFWSAFCDPVSGFMQDTMSWYEQYLGKSWGNRAPWATVSLLALMGLIFAAYFPPEGTYIFWYLWVLMASTFCYSTINVAYTASVFSIYKFKKERVITEGFGYMSKTAGLLLGFFFFVISLSDVSASVRIIQVFVGIGLFALGLLSIPVMKEAKPEKGSTSDERSLRTFWNTAKEMLFEVPSFQVVALVNVFDGARNAMTTLIPYYLSYVSKESVDNRSGYIVIMLVGTFFIKILLIIPTQWAVTKYGSAITSRVQNVDVVCQILVGVATLTCFPISKSGGMITAWLLIREIFKTPHIFWIILAYTWICDEDVLRTNKTRQGLIIGIANMTFQLAGAFFGAVMYFGMAGSGLDVKDCREFEDNDNLYDICYAQDIAAQPRAVEDYIYWSFIVAYTTLTCFMAWAISRFPIKGERLQKLEESKRLLIKNREKESFVGGTAGDDVAPPSVSVEMGVVRNAPISA